MLHTRYFYAGLRITNAGMVVVFGLKKLNPPSGHQKSEINAATYRTATRYFEAIPAIAF